MAGRRVLTDFSSDFELGQGIWLNAAAHAPMPAAGARAIREALTWKTQPDLQPSDAQSRVPQRLREAVGQLIGAADEDVVLGNSTTYAFDLIARSLPLSEG